MIFTESTIKISNNVSKMDSTIVLYRGDKNVEIRFTILQSPFKYSNTVATNVIESTNASYGQLVIKTPNDKPPIFSEVSATKEGTVLFTITKEMIDEIEEVGVYTFQIRLMDENKQSRVTIPPVENGIEIKEPIAIEDDNTTNVVGLAKANYAVATLSDTDTPTFDDNGKYNKTNWNDGDIITNVALNKIEDGIYTTNENVTATKKYVDDNTVIHPLPIYKMAEAPTMITYTVNIMDLKKLTTYGAIRDINSTKYQRYHFIYPCDDGTNKTIVNTGDDINDTTFRVYHYDNSSTLTFNNVRYSIDYTKHSTSTDVIVTEYIQNYLGIYNTREYTPTEDYNPATKKYVDDIKTGIDGIKADLGTAQLTTNAKDIKGAVNELNTQYKDIKKKQKISITDFGVLGNGGDETNLIKDAILQSSGKVLYFPAGVYGINNTLTINNEVSLELDANAKIIALTPMDVMIEWGKYNVYSEHHFIKGGIIDGMNKAKILINLSWFRHFTLKDTIFLNSIEKGIVLRSHEEDIHSVEAIVDNIYFENKTNTYINNTALVVNTTDSHISNVIMVNYTIGVELHNSGNRLFRIHPWVTHANRLNISKSFVNDASNNTFTECLADSTAIGYEINKNARILHSGYYCNESFTPTNIQIFNYNTTNNPFLIVENGLFEIKKQCENITVINEDALNEKVTFNNCIYINIPGKEEKNISYYITKPHETNTNSYYNFARIKIPKTNTISAMSLNLSLVDSNYGTSNLNDSCNIEMRLQGYKNVQSNKDFSNFNVKLYSNNNKYKDKLFAKGKVDDYNLIIDLFYKYDLNRWDYLLIKLDKIVGNLKSYNNAIKLDWFGTQHVLGNQLFIYDDGVFYGSLEDLDYTHSFDFDYSKILKELYIETGNHKASIYTDNNGLVIGSWDKTPIIKSESNTKNFKIINSSWNGGHLILGDYHLWVDENNKLRGKFGNPTNSLDGDLLSSQ